MIALHGFLGQPNDFAGILSSHSLTCPNWMKNFPMSNSALTEVARRLNHSLSKDILFGYSMGGRIALHMLVDQPRKFTAAIIVSASPGMTESENRDARNASDDKWAKRFLSEPWNEVIGAWNAQPVFAADPPDRLQRAEADYVREDLARALRYGSIAKQADLRPLLKELETSILWIAGEKDSKYSSLAVECAALNHRFRHAIIPNAGHRVPWGNLPAFERSPSTNS